MREVAPGAIQPTKNGDISLIQGSRGAGLHLDDKANVNHLVVPTRMPLNQGQDQTWIVVFSLNTLATTHDYHWGSYEDNGGSGRVTVQWDVSSGKFGSFLGGATTDGATLLVANRVYFNTVVWEFDTTDCFIYQDGELDGTGNRSPETNGSNGNLRFLNHKSGEFGCTAQVTYGIFVWDYAWTPEMVRKWSTRIFEGFRRRSGIIAKAPAPSLGTSIITLTGDTFKDPLTDAHKVEIIQGFDAA